MSLENSLKEFIKEKKKCYKDLEEIVNACVSISQTLNIADTNYANNFEAIYSQLYYDNKHDINRVFESNNKEIQKLFEQQMEYIRDSKFKFTGTLNKYQLNAINISLINNINKYLYKRIDITSYENLITETEEKLKIHNKKIINGISGKDVGNIINCFYLD